MLGRNRATSYRRECSSAAIYSGAQITCGIEDHTHSDPSSRATGTNIPSSAAGCSETANRARWEGRYANDPAGAVGCCRNQAISLTAVSLGAFSWSASLRDRAPEPRQNRRAPSGPPKLNCYQAAEVWRRGRESNSRVKVLQFDSVTAPRLFSSGCVRPG